LVPYRCNAKNGFGGHIGKDVHVLRLQQKDGKWCFNTGLPSDYFLLLYGEYFAPKSL
jgi:hypothetical protein